MCLGGFPARSIVDNRNTGKSFCQGEDSSLSAVALA